MSDIEEVKHLLLNEEQCHICKKWFPAPLDDMTQDKDGNRYLTCEKCIQSGWERLSDEAWMGVDDYHEDDD
jgi:hypothetical protein